MVAMMWASLQRRHFAMTDWGMLQDGLSLLLKRGEKPTLVQWMLFFEQKLPGWDGSAQCDAAEFTLALNGSDGPLCVSWVCGNAATSVRMALSKDTVVRLVHLL